MASKSYQDLQVRLRDIEQLVAAHTSVVKFNKSQALLRRAGRGSQTLQTAITALNALVASPGPGRVAEVGAINRAAIVLLSAHLEGFLEDLHREAANALLSTRVSDLESLVSQAARRFSNPSTEGVKTLFKSIGISDVLDGISWQRAGNLSIRKRINDNVDLRNKIAHGSMETVTKMRVMSNMKFNMHLAQKMDEQVGLAIRRLTGSSPW